ncbi:UBN2 domain-containing protein [Cephalotus follicularis]|uniref:UBN2 domain-containing protein n=1 Tax=Cephalotus follicularis TaxID=3775 RepID=A0A1Q3CCJ5_CEPFO|nr:UBN2 domain-containing protein [Cephalotus follicularis]
MEIYLKSRDFRNWLSVKNGPHIPTKLNDKNELISKSEDEWDEDDFRKLTIDNKSLNILLVSLDKTEYNLVRRCTSAHEVWKLLILTHEGTEQVKNAKLDLLNRDYELFKMQPNESIKNLYNRLLDITNGLLGLGKVFGQDELVRKLLGCPMMKSKDLKTMEIEELLGSLMTHEVKLNKKSTNLVETKPQEERRKDIALKSTHKEEV